MLLCMEVGAPKSLVLSRELSEPDIIAEGLCIDWLGNAPEAAAAAAACAANAEAAKLLTPPNKDDIKAECCFSGVVAGVASDVPLFGDESKPTGEIEGGAPAGLPPLLAGRCGAAPLLFWFTTHFLICFSRVEATLKGMSQKRHLKMSFPIRPWVRMCLVSFELCAHA